MSFDKYITFRERIRVNLIVIDTTLVEMSKFSFSHILTFILIISGLIILQFVIF